MKKSIEFDISLNQAQFFRLTKDYFTNLGFDLKDQTASSINFKRGSTLLNFFTMNPLAWKSTIDISINDNFVTAKFNISTIGQTVTDRENQFWVELIENYHQGIQEGKELSNQTQSDLNDTKSNTYGIIKAAVIGAIAVGVPAMLIAYFTGYDTIALVGVGAGATGGITSKLNRKAL
ncbi:hypothetical protein [Reichenbachiella ulvae]|uniref:Glycine zipper family protein n=1 Tax=Reichenbachiella ulvae TaxID=2980104 RepID=A0ABT3CTS5_9BACT|nr:hypothetical protein [Reichenbachiella ulvae]MCV9386986.1 hypothetical protein [Reichenbachiella ulvae]